MSEFVSAKSRGPLTARRLALVLGGCLALVALAAIVAPLLGIVIARDGWHLELMSPSAALDPASPEHAIWMVRLPRVLASLLVGGALAGSGCALQALLRNPLAEPFTLGISSGSALAAVLAIRLGLEGAFGTLGVGGAALVGSAGTLFVVWKFGSVDRRLPPATLVLAGVTVSMFCSSASVLVQYTSDFAEVSHMLQWMMGGLDNVRLSMVGWATIPIASGFVVLVLHARALDALAAGPEVAASLGVAVERTQTVVFVVASLLVGCAIALVGPIGFVGLIVPHALRGLIGPDHRLLLPASILGGAVLLVLCDTLARTIVPMHHLPTGAVTAVLGGPFFVGILLRQKSRASFYR